MRVDSSTLTTQIFPRANAVALSSRSVMQAIGTKANSFAGKMVLDQLNGVISGQFTSLVTTGKFQSFKEMLTDPSTYIGFATSAATTKGGGPTRANTDVAPAPKVNANVEAPRVNVDVNAPRANVEVNAPRTNVEPTAPRVNADVNAPKANTEVNAPRTNADVNAPRVDADAPRTSADTPAKKPGAFESFQNRIEAIQSKYTSAGEAFGTKVGNRVNDFTGTTNAKSAFREEYNNDLPEGTQRITGIEDGKLKLEIGPNSRPEDIAIHQQKLRQMRAEMSPLQRMRQRLNGEEPAVKNEQWQTAHEVDKHQRIADSYFDQANNPKLDAETRAEFIQKAHEALARSYEYEAKIDDANTGKNSAADDLWGNKPSFDNEAELRPLVKQQYESGVTVLPAGYVEIRIKGDGELVGSTLGRGSNARDLGSDRIVLARRNPDGTLDMTKGIMVVNEKGTITLGNDNRISRDWTDRYTAAMKANVDGVRKIGLDGKEITFSREGYTVHHIIPDKTLTGSPFGCKAMELTGYNVDRTSNYRAMPMEQKFMEINGQEVGHWTDHPEFSAQVTRTLLDYQTALEQEFGATRGRDRFEMSNWDKTTLSPDEIKLIEAAMRQAEVDLNAIIDNPPPGMTSNAITPSSGANKGKTKNLPGQGLLR
jgi:A nuclease family of the HNH/ENDO VII superfamily with conserved AHH